ncbi:acetyl-CoA carboxylase biotin carboxyl carrier protein subunit [Mucilaginibacter sp. BT774]|uniref:acetyl-CoA carboxylase biotin carboxyl carrier protein subunit n=1 Tax=Mucilaginibacter sp. BT774 TaxID=3062276 RepID=UPI002675D8AF|nr:biotin/lipoyl-containing protein [Mucilaginibacter sp. BT774]MDO3628995.1 biotin/lipoyl-containing protein [Mucilaginibacter sp. BT774]
MYKLKINDKAEYKIEKTRDKLFINDKEINADIQQLNETGYHIINDLRSYNAEVVSFDKEAKIAQIKVNGNLYSVTAQDQFDILLDQLGLNAMNANKVSDIKAPMPGLVLKLLVSEGSQVKKGDNLFVLEAMKMENIIKSPADVTVKSIKIKPGDKVEKGQVLLLFQ